ncbi:MAG: hypothetical protein R2822_04770 [Spirosomataceae bacterium]
MDDLLQTLKKLVANPDGRKVILWGSNVCVADLPKTKIWHL